MRFTIAALACMLLLGCTGQGTASGRAALVIDFGNSTVYSECIGFTENSTAADMLASSGLQFSIKDDPNFGPALCGIDGIGCPDTNCFCDERYWGFYYDEGDEWTYSNVGMGSLFDGNRTIVMDGAVIGFRWGEYGQLPPKTVFDSVCQ
ncbi:MAG: hypothetical protein ABIG39_01990 [Candidatus Micrarchaeota archaeon]